MAEDSDDLERISYPPDFNVYDGHRLMEATVLDPWGVLVNHNIFAELLSSGGTALSKKPFSYLLFHILYRKIPPLSPFLCMGL